MRTGIAAAAAATVLLGATAGWLVFRMTGPGPAPAAAPPPPAEPPRAGLAPEEVLHRAESRRMADLEEQRARFRTLREAYAAARPSPAAQKRLEPALRQLWPPPDALRWSCACRGLVCRLEVQGPQAGWRPGLEGSGPVRAAVDRMAFDPDGADAAALLLLPASATARPPDDALAALERGIRESAEVRGCLAASEQAGTLDYELSVDASGFTYRTGGDLDTAVLRCASDAVNDIIGLMAAPVDAKSASRRLELRARGK